jgi:hypothetical protein
MPSFARLRFALRPAPMNNERAMATRAVPIAPRTPVEAAPAPRARWLAFGAPLVALLGGMSAEWLDFRELRVPLLFMVGFGVLATAYRMTGTRAGWRAFAVAVLVGVATWAAVEGVYTITHVARGEQFHADRFGPQWSQAIGLIAAHGLFLGTPTGAAAGVMLQWRSLWRRLRGR